MRLVYVVIVLNVDSPFMVNCVEYSFVMLIMFCLNIIFMFLLTLCV